jgi:type III pantothenate kinase
MKPDIVVDVGNTWVKWGRCGPAGVADRVSLPHADVAAWAEQRQRWQSALPLSWVISGVQPAQRDRLVEWVRQQGDTVFLLDNPKDLPLFVRLEHPERVGVDRLLDAVAANARRPPETPAVIVDAGSAVTVDYVDCEGAFRGGAIFPGLRLMSQALHDYTALLPLVDVAAEVPLLPGTCTPSAMRAGIFWAVAGGAAALIRALGSPAGPTPAVYVTGGDAGVVVKGLGSDVILWPDMTLEGIRLSAEALP